MAAQSARMHARGAGKRSDLEGSSQPDLATEHAGCVIVDENQVRVPSADARADRRRRLQPPERLLLHPKVVLQRAA
eukprot:3566989-Rhodomonas_salina.1